MRQLTQTCQQQAFSYDSGNNYVFVNVYNEDNATHPLNEDGTGIIDITGSGGQEDVVVQSAAISGNLMVGKASPTNKSRRWLSLHRASRLCVYDISQFFVLLSYPRTQGGVREGPTGDVFPPHSLRVQSLCWLNHVKCTTIGPESENETIYSRITSRYAAFFLRVDDPNARQKMINNCADALLLQEQNGPLPVQIPVAVCVFQESKQDA